MGRRAWQLGTIALAAALAGGASAQQEMPDRATMVAELLAGLDTPARKPAARRRQAATMRTLDRLGAHSLDETQARPAAGQPFRGRVLGPAYQRGWLDAGATMTLQQQFMAGQRASIAAVGTAIGVVPGTAPGALTLTVTEPGEQPVCHEAPRACRWLPLYTQRYAITLRNPGTARVRYYLVLD